MNAARRSHSAAFKLQALIAIISDIRVSLGIGESDAVCRRPEAASGKSFCLALIAIFLGCFHDWRPFLGPGEVGTIMVVAQDRKGARTIMRFALGLLQAVPMLKRQIESVTQESITLRNSVVIEIHTAS